jgi:hypothetical protein
MKMKRIYLFSLMAALSFPLIYCGESSPSSPTTTTSSSTISSTTTSVPEKPVVLRETGERFSKIQNALDAASEGQHIDVSPGEYVETLVIEKKIYLTGENRNNTIIDGKGSNGYPILFSAGSSSPEVRGFTIQNGNKFSGILGLSGGAVIERCIVKNNKIGICLENTYGKISRVIVKNNSFLGIEFRICSSWLKIEECVFEVNSTGICCYSNSEFPVVEHCTIENNSECGIYCGPLDRIDLGGGFGESPGFNVIRNNEEWDFYNGCIYEIKAEYNYWDHTTAEEIDSLDIYDDDEDSESGAVDFEPFLTSLPIASLMMKPRMLYASSLFADFFRSLFRSDLPASAIYISASVEAKTDFSRYELIRARYRPLADEHYYPPLILRARR